MSTAANPSTSTTTTTTTTSPRHPTWLRDAAHAPSAPERQSIPLGIELLDGRFLIERQLGSGGMGVVYQAWDRVAREHVAVKTLAVLKPSSVYRLKLEYRALADVRHPNIVTMRALFEDQGRWCLVMELLRGRTLARVMEQSPPIEVMRELFGQVACGLSALHAAGRVHRDLTPANVMVTPEGKAVIMDFGLVSEQGVGVPGQTIVDGQVSGTPGYLSPEQAAGRMVTPKSDWYALGVMLRESLAGYEAASHVTPPPSAVRSPSARLVLERLCGRLLEREPERRASESTVLAALGMTRERVAPRVSQRVRSSPGALERELSELNAAYLATDDDQPVVAWVRGPPGSGKTTLVRSFLEDVQAREEALVLCGRCDPRETLPLRAIDGVVDALSRHLRSMTYREAHYLLPRGIDALAAMFPALGRIEGLLQSRRRRREPPEGAKGSRAVAVAALKELLGRLAVHRPLVLFIDDLQHGDPESAQLLAELLSPPDPPPLLLIAAARSGRRGEEADAAKAFAQVLRRAAGPSFRLLRMPAAQHRHAAAVRSP